MLEVENRSPVVRPILLEATRGTGGRGTIVDARVHREIECVLSKRQQRLRPLAEKH
jgi:hypothetical protein